MQIKIRIKLRNETKEKGPEVKTRFWNFKKVLKIWKTDKSKYFESSKEKYTGAARIKLKLSKIKSRQDERQNLNDLRDVIPCLSKPTKNNILKGAIKFINKLKSD